MNQAQSNDYNPVDRATINRLRDIFSTERVSDDEVDLQTYAYDAIGRHYPPEAVVWAESASEISALMKLACERRIPVYPRGGGTGLTGGSLATQGGIVLSLERMDAIGSIDEENRLMTAQTGVRLSDLKTAAQQHGLFYPPDPSSAKTATLGGTLAECAGGLNCVKYGTTKDWVQQIQAVLPDGEMIRAGSKVRKSVVGYNLLQLLIGSEGTLAVITDTVLRLIPFPAHRATFVALFDSVTASVKAVQRMMESGVTPCAIEFIDRSSLESANAHQPDQKVPVADALLLVETDGYDEETVRDEIRILADVCRQGGATSVTESQSSQERDRLWDIRRSLNPAMFAQSRFKTNEDICVPLSEIPGMLEDAYTIGRKYNIPPLCFGHAGDGNIHFNFMSNQEHDPDVERATEELFQRAIERSGSISGEHGIGITKAPYLGYEMGERERELLRQIKQTFDPHQILNPGKIVA